MDDQDKCRYVPTPEAIAEGCLQAQADWTPAERRRRQLDWRLRERLCVPIVSLAEWQQAVREARA